MSGIPGVALSDISIASLFTTCVQCFDIVIAGWYFSEKYEQIFTRVSYKDTFFLITLS